MPRTAIPIRTVIDGNFYEVAGKSEAQPRWRSKPVPSTLGDPTQPQRVALGSGAAGIVASRRTMGRPTPHGIATSLNAATDIEDVYGAGPFVTLLDALTKSVQQSATANPGTLANDAAVGANAWSDPGNAAASDDSDATVATAGLSNYLKATNFGFSLPASAVPTGIGVTIERAGPGDTGADSPGTEASDGTVGTLAWSSPGNAAASDDSHATAAPAGAAEVTEYLKVTNFGFALEATAQILGIEFVVERKETEGTTDANTGSRLPGSAVNNGARAGSQFDWSNETQITNGGEGGGQSAATGGPGSEVPQFGYSSYLVGHNFGFAVPAGATILGYAATWRMQHTEANFGTDDDSVKLWTGSAIGSEKATNTTFPAAFTSYNYGGSADTWGTSLSVGAVNASSFGVAMSVRKLLAFEVDFGARAAWVRLTVYYRTAAGVIDSQVRVVKADASFGTTELGDLVTEWPETDTNKTYGGSTNLLGESWANTDVNDADFGLALSASVAQNATAHVDHVTCRIYFKDLADNIVRLVDAVGTIVGDDKATASLWPTTDGDADYGGPADMWGTAFTKANVEDVDFGVVLSADVGTDASAAVDHIEVTIYYDEQVTSEATAIWADGNDSSGDPFRYVYVGMGSRIHVIDPVTDGEVKVEEYGDTVDGFSAARWAGDMWIAKRGDLSSDYVLHASSPWNGTAHTLADTDYFGRHLVAGPDALYRGYRTATNEALIKKTDEEVVANVALDANWSPSGGEPVGDPGIPITNLEVLGRRLLVGKEDGVGELDQDYVYRHYLNWVRDFRYSKNASGILPLGLGGAFLTTHRRGLYLLPGNEPTGVETLDANEEFERGRYLALAFDGVWIWAALFHHSDGDTNLIKMRPRRLPGPGIWEHHVVATLSAAETTVFYLWPGANIDGTDYPPRLWFGHGEGQVGYLVIGEELGDRTFNIGAWSITWPHDDLGSPTTFKFPHKIEATYKGVAGTTGITWTAEPDDDGSPVNLTADGDTGAAPVTTDGFANRFGPRDESTRGRTLQLSMSGTASSKTAQQRIVGQIVFTYLEQPDHVDLIEALLQLHATDLNEEDAKAQYDTLKALIGRIVELVTSYVDDDEADDETLYATVVAVEEAQAIETADASGVIMASIVLRATDFS